MDEKIIFLGGEFNNEGGRKSTISDILYNSMGLKDAECHNGGHLSELENIAQRAKEYSLAFWFAQIPKGMASPARIAKNTNPALTLVGSLRNMDNVPFLQVVNHALVSNHNLLVEFSKINERYQARVLDPLGNVYAHTQNMKNIASVVKNRAFELLKYTRIGSTKEGEQIPAPHLEKFYTLVREKGELFSQMVESVAREERFMGNASFRCERGFPSFKEDNLIFVSRRNVNKISITQNDFVAVKPSLPVEYFGNAKPSVDTPIQIKLYNNYPWAKYLLHGHAYIKNAPFTNRIVPCGAIEESEEIISLFPNRSSVNFSVNLKGHGSLTLADNIASLRSVEYICRPVPEYNTIYGGKYE